MEKQRNKSHVASLRRLRSQAQKSAVNLRLFEDVLLLSVLQAFVAGRVALIAPADLIGWFPDRDNMTTFANGAWSGLAFMNFVSFWRQRVGARQMPGISTLDHRSESLESSVYDPLVRVPDFLAATLSRWDTENRQVARPLGAKAAAMRRYFKIMMAWMPENHDMWVGRLRFDEDGPRVGRIVSAKNERRLRRYSAP